MSKHSSLLIALLAAAGVVFSACDVEIVYIDPPVKLVSETADMPVGPPELELGFYEGGVYRPLEAGSELPVVHGLQGGTWTMPAVRTRGLGTYAELICRLVTASGEQVGYVGAKTKFYFNGAGHLEVANFPIPVFHPDRPQDAITDLYDMEATLTCTLENGEDAAAFEVALVISEG